MKYNLVVCGGTFDHFHKGHKKFLRYALSIGNNVLLGLTSDKFIKSKNNSEWIEDYQSRKQRIEEFLVQEKANNRVQIEPIDNIFIPKAWEDLSIEAIIVSKNTIQGAEKINIKRKEQKKTPLKIDLCPLVKSEYNEYISSSRIRSGEINREGMPYINPLWFRHKLVLTEELREILRKPFGTVFRTPNEIKIQKCPFLITVGDVITKLFNELNLNQNLSVVDFNVARVKKFSNFEELGFVHKVKVINVKNSAGCLTPSLFSEISRVFSDSKNERIVLQIEGEEDLAVLPIVLSAPLNSIVFYGQPGQGLVRVIVSEENKEKVYGLLEQTILEVIDK